MKKFIDILEEIKQTVETVKALEAQEKNLTESYMKICDLKERHEARKAVENDMMKVSEEKKDLQITIKILKNNARIALFNEVLPVALDVLKKYAGKPYGEKTKQKISDEVKEKTNCRFYIRSSYGSHSYEIYPVDGFEYCYIVTCGTDHTDGNHEPLLIDNKIQLVTTDKIGLYFINREYVVNIPARVEELKRLYAEAFAKQQELKAACDRFNDLAVEDIKHLYYDKHIYTNMDM